mmetsp:Transcript_52823/g.123573  ORF Transcript_52823/g.123573 Transcript_52823/m.123573 type:complete len:254 (+) Transcript_52823:69-830(+)
MQLRAAVLNSALLAIAFTLQGCDLAVPQHDIGNWRGLDNYEFAYQFVPPGHPQSDALLNSCMSSTVPFASRCNGHGVCKQWRSTVATDAEADALYFCQCEVAYADPECRTLRKSQKFTFMLSICMGLLGVDQWYLGFWQRAILKCLSCGGFGLWWLFDIVRIGSTPVYGFDSFRLANDLAYWEFVVILTAFLCFIAFSIGVISIMWHKVQKSRLIVSLQVDRKKEDIERLKEQAYFADEGYARGAGYGAARVA